MLTMKTHYLHPGRSEAMLSLRNDFFVMGDGDDLSCSSQSTIMDDTDESSISDDSDCDDMSVDLSAHSMRMRQRNRSTVSLAAYLSKPTAEPLKLPSATEQRALARHGSIKDLDMHKPTAEQRHLTRGSSIRIVGGMKAIQKVSAQASLPGDGTPDQQTPDQHLSKLLETKLDRVPYDSLGDYFLKIAPQHIAAWNSELLRAVRTQDYNSVRKMHLEGKPMQASNQFGESILHVCVRRGTPEILNYLLREGKVSPRVRCDYGRTPLHDALWTFDGSDRSLKIMALLLRQNPEMLLITDKRGFTPLDYVPRDQWPAVCKFLDRCLPFLGKLRNNGRAGGVSA